MYKTNIIHIIDTLGIGGAEKILVGTVNGLPGFRHHVVYLNGSDALVSSLPADCKVVKLNCRSKFDMLRCVVDLRKYIKKNNIGIVHSHLFMASLVARLACPKNVKLFTTIHNLPSYNFFSQSRIANWLEKITTRKHHHLVAICHEVFKDYKKKFGVKGDYTILYNYVDDDFYKKQYRAMNFKEQFRMIAVGNLKKQKNYSYLAEAFKKMPKNIFLDIYGGGAEEAELRSLIEKHQLNIRLCGVHKDIQQLLPTYDAFIMSSRFEGQPISLLEAMASGMPAILSDIPVLREVTNNKAIFFDLDNVNDLVTKVTAIANHQVDLDEFAKANFERIKKIGSRENYMTMLNKIYLDHAAYRIETMKKSPAKIFRPALTVDTSWLLYSLFLCA
jgi:glycosyltransferase involved in cell wall biosynthesis